MSSLTHAPAAPERIRGCEARRVDAPARLKLVPSCGGWSLASPDGKVVFQALGRGARQQCLEFARAHGVLAVFS